MNLRLTVANRGQIASKAWELFCQQPRVWHEVPFLGLPYILGAPPLQALPPG